MFEFAISWNAHVMMGGGALHDGMMAKKGEKGTVIPTLKILSPETIRRNVSNDNFLKFQWPWTV